MEFIWVHIDNNKKDKLILDIVPIQGSDDTALTVEAQYSINFSTSNRRFRLSFHYNGSNRFLFVNATKIYKFNAKHSEIKIYLFC